MSLISTPLLQVENVCWFLEQNLHPIFFGQSTKWEFPENTGWFISHTVFKSTGWLDLVGKKAFTPPSWIFQKNWTSKCLSQMNSPSGHMFDCMIMCYVGVISPLQQQFNESLATTKHRRFSTRKMTWKCLTLFFMLFFSWFCLVLFFWRLCRAFLVLDCRDDKGSGIILMCCFCFVILVLFQTFQ